MKHRWKILMTFCDDACKIRVKSDRETSLEWSWGSRILDPVSEQDSCSKSLKPVKDWLSDDRSALIAIKSCDLSEFIMGFNTWSIIHVTKRRAQGNITFWSLLGLGVQFFGIRILFLYSGRVWIFGRSIALARYMARNAAGSGNELDDGSSSQ